MLTRINAKGVQNALNERLASDGELLAAAGALFSFFATVTSGQPLTFAAGLGLVVTTAGEAVKGCTELVRRLCGSETKVVASVEPYERFRVMFYAACVRAYIEAIPEGVRKLQALPSTKGATTGKTKRAPKELTEALQMRIAKVEETEVAFLLGVDPLKGEVPLYAALSEWLLVALEYHGFADYQSRPILNEVAGRAKQRFAVFLSSNRAEASWIRNYLLLGAHATGERIASDLASMRAALDQWTQRRAELRDRQAAAWESYRAQLRELPDHKDSMFNEPFGVRQVFVRPEGTYAVQGAEGETATPHMVSDLGSVLGGLLSTRVPGEDLIILCGGPGSGKSTLCRVLASELASAPSMMPIFLRLRRLKEGADIPAFLEGQLSKLGLIDRIADLRDLSNVVLILDGFDELVMASRSRLRQFFNALREDHTNGVLRGMRIVVSGRDTLFPGGEGLPLGSHVLTLVPFDRPRVAFWGEKWRSHHSDGKGATFRPESLLGADGRRPSGLQHLVSWPLTLHLVARVHTSGRLQVDEGAPTLTKATLYRSILAETATRQREQTDGGGRLDPKNMREFLRTLAWRMYEDGRDSMDPAEVLPILQRFFPGKSEVELSELADVAVVNSPELTRGEQTGFEFVHKSFGEYLCAEEIAIGTERVAFIAPDYGSEDLTWRMSEKEAADELARLAAVRLLTPEVQEMFEPMLGDFTGFAKDGQARHESRLEGLERIVGRCEALLGSFLRGQLAASLDGRVTRPRNLWEGQANFAAGLLLIGTGAVRQLLVVDEQNQRRLLVQPFDGSLWRLLALLQAGGVLMDEHTTRRIFSGCTIRRMPDDEVQDVESPFKTAWLQVVEGFEGKLDSALAADAVAREELVAALQMASLLLFAILPESAQGPSVEYESRHFLERLMRDMDRGRFRDTDGYSVVADLLVRTGFASGDALREHEYRHGMRHPLYELLRTEMPHGALVQQMHERFAYSRHIMSRHRADLGPGYVEILWRLFSDVLERAHSDHSRESIVQRLRELLRHMR